MPIFVKQLDKIDPKNAEASIKTMANHLRYMQEQMEYTLTNLDSANIVEIDTDKTVVTDTSGSSSIGSYISLKGDNGEGFSAGKNEKGVFEFRVKGNGGVEMIAMSTDGKLWIRENANLIAFLASDEASYISGTSIRIDGCRKTL